MQFVFDHLTITTSILAEGTATMVAGWLSNIWNITQVVLGLGFVIFVHELGHFLAAKFFGVKCEKFYVGFDVPISLGPLKLPAKLFHVQWGETEYGIGSIPLGGYVKMLGQDDDPRNAEKENERIRVEDITSLPGESDNPRAKYDPRSFPAKSVLARMVIISAGVIMNVIFGIIFVACAYSIGHAYQPTIVAGVIPGGPAWVEDVRRGDKILEVADMSAPDEKLDYRDMIEAVALAGFDKPTEPVPLKVRRDGKEVDLEVVGTKRTDPDGNVMRLGILMPFTTQVDKDVFPNGFKAEYEKENLLPALESGDVIVAVNGQRLAPPSWSESLIKYQLDYLMHPLADETLNVTVKRSPKDSKNDTSKDSTEVTLEWKPLPYKSIGIGFLPGGVSSIKKGSPAEKAEIQIGDIPTTFDGDLITDAVALPFMIAKNRGKTVKMMFKRGPDDIELAWTIPNEFQYFEGGRQFHPFGIEAIGSGVVFETSSTISSIDNSFTESTTGEGNSERRAEIGDSIAEIRLETPSTDVLVQEIKDRIGPKDYEELLHGKSLNAEFTSQNLMSIVQVLPKKSKLLLYSVRETPGENNSSSSKLIRDLNCVVGDHPQWKNPDRGVMFEPLELLNRTSSVGEALSMGVTEMKKRAFRVVQFVYMAFSYKVPRKAAAGPVMIFSVATNEASKGIPDLLMFLAMLSANLAVLNFLPVPALDGGHMAFLIYEGIFRRPVNEKVQMRLTLAGVLMILLLMLFVTSNDIFNLVEFFRR